MANLYYTGKYDPLASLPDLDGLTAIVTGSNTGIGKYTAQTLAQKNCKVYIAARNEAKAQKAIDGINALDVKYSVSYLSLDLSDLQSIHSAAKEFDQREKDLHILVNNAGVMMAPFTLTKYQIELEFMTNHIGHFYFTQLLLPKILDTSTRSPKGTVRIVSVASPAHLYYPRSTFNFNNINLEKSWYGVRYAQSKLANILHSKKIHSLHGEKVVCIAVDPGFIASDLYQHMAATWLYKPIVYLISFLQINEADGSLNNLYAAAHTGAAELGGKYISPYARLGILSGAAKSQKNADELWDWTLEWLRDQKAESKL